MAKNEDLESLTNPEISKRLLRTLRNVQTLFAGMVLFTTASAGFSFALNSWGLNTIGAGVSITSALVVVGCLFYLRTLRRRNEALIEVSNKRNSP